MKLLKFIEMKHVHHTEHKYLKPRKSKGIKISFSSILLMQNRGTPRKNGLKDIRAVSSLLERLLE